MGGGSTLVAFEVKGGKQAAFRLADALAVIVISNNLGDAKSIISHPAHDDASAHRAGGAGGTGDHRRACCACRSGSRTATT